MYPTNRFSSSPGEILLEEFLKPMNISQDEFVKATGVSNQELNDIIKGKCRLTNNLAISFANFFNTTPEFWINLQNQYEIILEKPFQNEFEIAQHFLTRGNLVKAREILTSTLVKFPNNIHFAILWNELQHMEESEQLGRAIFPMFIPFEKRWEGPHIAKLQKGNTPLKAWYPGRIIALGESILLELAEPPTDSANVQIFHSEMTQKDFLECTQYSSLEFVSEGQFLEVAIVGNDTWIELYPIRRHRIT